MVIDILAGSCCISLCSVVLFGDYDGMSAKLPNSKKQRLDDENTNPSPIYEIRDGLRFVKPYWYTYRTFCKERWIGKTLLQVFQKEFQDRPLTYYKQAISQGRMRVNHAKVSETYVLKNSDLITHEMHRHEPPVTDQQVHIVYQDSEVLVVDKPASIPVHPSGRFHFNSLTEILKNTGFDHALHLVNRIDRLVSGLVIIARDKQTAARLVGEMVAGKIHKTYLARVRGEFPSGVVECSEPLETANFKAGINVVAPLTGKPSTTVFKRISTNGVTSVVDCRPVTGRTHQIRVHLQFLGYPIANDPLYGCDAWPYGGKGGVDSDNLTEIIAKVVAKAFPDPAKEGGLIVNVPNEPDLDGAGILEIQPLSRQQDLADGSYCPKCIECMHEKRLPIREQLEMYLHSYRYENTWNYQSEMPIWAREDFDDTHLERFWSHGGVWDGNVQGEVITNKESK